ncbi:hypothetical protein DENIS_2621 [Desulfonema ishimotonii]|uniref:Uncharacterized protein n=1 Tax=Desulfonema ishimotonii TaxID=45657 RepID=A0A401FXI6_9BACT|nr:hypothetical protein [Desulfonema ishimotonii]GBC61659.1 hypothetical protein DENIS_2621 [Desulfonema ishimotonii]
MVEDPGKELQEEVKQLLMMQMVHLDAVTRLMVEKEMITKDELVTMLRRVEYEYRQKGLIKE